jgi:hypothetical protein
VPHTSQLVASAICGGNAKPLAGVEAGRTRPPPLPTPGAARYSNIVGKYCTGSDFEEDGDDGCGDEGGAAHLCIK